MAAVSVLLLRPAPTLHPPPTTATHPLCKQPDKAPLLHSQSREGKKTAIKAETILRKRKPQKSVPAIPAVLSLPAAFPSESSLDLTWVGKRL